MPHPTRTHLLDCAPNPLQRVLDCVAFRRAIITDDLPACTCPAGTLVQEVYAIRDARATAVPDHTATLEADLHNALTARHITSPRAASQAPQTQTESQGAFVMAKATADATLVREALGHLGHDLRLIFDPKDTP